LSQKEPNNDTGARMCRSPWNFGLVTTEWLKCKREGVLVDHRQSGWGKTIASAYSVRPKPGRAGFVAASLG